MIGGVAAAVLLLGAGAFAYSRLNAARRSGSAAGAADQRGQRAAQGVVLNATGYIVAAHKIELAAKVIGKVNWIGVDKGDKVKEGQVLVRLEDDEYQAQLTRPREACEPASPSGRSLHGSRPEEIAQALANLNSAKADLENARVSLDRDAQSGAREAVLAAIAGRCAGALRFRRRQGEFARRRPTTW